MCLNVCLLINNVKTVEGIGMKFRTAVDYDLEYDVGYFLFHGNAGNATIRR